MSEALVDYVPNKTQPAAVSRDLFNFWRRVLKLQRGRMYTLVLKVPERQDQPITWAFMGDGKEENEG